MSVKMKNVRIRNGNYCVQVMRDGKFFNRTFKRLIDAQKFLEQVKQTGEAPNMMTFTEAAKQWLGYANLRKKDSTRTMDDSRLKCGILEFIGNRRLDRIQPRHIEELMKHLKDRGASDSTVNRYLQLIKAVFNYHKKRGIVQSNPVDTVGMLKVGEKSFNFWTTEEAERFLAHTEQKYKDTPHWSYHLFYLTALNTGLRRGELLGLRWEDINFGKEILTVRRSYSNATREIVESTKNRKIRHVPIPTWLCKKLLEIKKGSAHSDLIFSVSGQVIEPNNFYNRNFLPDMRDAGVRRIRIHDLRHTFASHYMMNGGNIFHLQHILGHCSIGMTMRYAHFSNEYLDKTRNIVRFGDNGKVISVDFQRPAVNS